MSDLDRLTIVTPTFEKHYHQFAAMVGSLVAQCTDLDAVELTVIVESHNVAMFSDLLDGFAGLTWRIKTTEEVFADFGITEPPGAFLQRIGKFTFQTLKKLGALRRVSTAWSLVLDSESLFHKPFRALDLLADYAARKYVFYTSTAARGRLWHASVGYQVTVNAGRALAQQAGDRWYMEYFHWFYETTKVEAMIARLGRLFFEGLADPQGGAIDYFENILYYLYLERYHADEYDFVDLKVALDRFLPPELSARFRLSELPFALFGNEYIVSVLAPDEVGALAPLFAHYRLPFARLEPPVFRTGYLPALAELPYFVATISSQHAVWMRKRIAVLVSGEFRHIIHRTPEQQVRHLLGFLNGVDCDIYVHGWTSPDEAVIVDGLRPRAVKFEPHPNLARLASRIAVAETDIKPGRDQGSLAMFYSLEQAWRLMAPHADEYDYVLRIRPDLYSERSLKEILVRITDEGDLVKGSINVPAHFHSKGINDQLAIGPTAAMQVYCTVFGELERTIEAEVFNPETVLLRRLLANDIGIVLVDMPYALMREIPFHIDAIHERFHSQHGVWWARTEPWPRYMDLGAYFADKLKAVDALLRKEVPPLAYLTVPHARDGTAVIRAKLVENDPAREAAALFRGPGHWRLGQFVIDEAGVVEVDDTGPRQMFVFTEDDTVVVSEWRMAQGKMVNHRLTVPGSAMAATARGAGVRIGVAHFIGRHPGLWHWSRRISG